MLRYLAYGYRDFRDDGPLPDPFSKRRNWEFFAVFGGRIRPLIDGGEALRFRSRALWLMHPEVRYRWESDSAPCLRCVFQFTDVPLPVAKRFEEGGLSHLAVDLDDAEGARVQQISRLLEPHHFNPSDLSFLWLQNALTELCIQVTRDLQTSARQGLRWKVADRVHAAETWYLSHLPARPTVEQVASAVHVSSSQLRRYFREIYGTSPNAAFKRHRLAEVARLLTETDKTLEDIAQTTGFANLVDFHRSFKARFGKTPDRWRRETGETWGLSEPGRSAGASG